MYRFIEILLGILFSVSAFLITLMAIKLSDLFGSLLFLGLVPVCLGLLLYLYLYVEDYTHYLILSLTMWKYKREKRKGNSP